MPACTSTSTTVSPAAGLPVVLLVTVPVTVVACAKALASRTPAAKVRAKILINFIGVKTSCLSCWDFLNLDFLNLDFFELTINLSSRAKRSSLEPKDLFFVSLSALLLGAPSMAGFCFCAMGGIAQLSTSPLAFLSEAFFPRSQRICFSSRSPHYSGCPIHGTFLFLCHGWDSTTLNITPCVSARSVLPPSHRICFSSRSPHYSWVPHPWHVLVLVPWVG